MLAGYATILQVAHPTVGAGVEEHSNFKQDPWGRLYRTLDFLYKLVYGTPEESAAEARRIFEMHKSIRRVDPNRPHYSALEPEAFEWVHATLAKAIVEGHRLFGRNMSAATAEKFWQEWLALGQLLGIRPRESAPGRLVLPQSWCDFDAYFDRMVAERLENNRAVQDVIDAIPHAAAPHIPGIGPVWPMLRIGPGKVLRLSTTGALPASLRSQFGMRWTIADRLAFEALSHTARKATPVMPASLLCVGPIWLKATKARA
jgi:uncharacterized protein (DUF2236 family)